MSRSDGRDETVAGCRDGHRSMVKGRQTVVIRAADGLNAGDVIESTAVLTVGIVDRAGQTP